MDTLRYKLANRLFGLGLRALPPGRVRSELSQLLDLWRTKVENTVRKAKETAGGE